MPCQTPQSCTSAAARAASAAWPRRRAPHCLASQPKSGRRPQTVLSKSIRVLRSDQSVRLPLRSRGPGCVVVCVCVCPADFDRHPQLRLRQPHPDTDPASSLLSGLTSALKMADPPPPHPPPPLQWKRCRNKLIDHSRTHTANGCCSLNDANISYFLPESLTAIIGGRNHPYPSIRPLRGGCSSLSRE